MARRKRESSARGHTTAPLVVENVNPLTDHPGLTPLIDKRTRRIAKGAAAKAKVKVKVAVETQHGG